MTGAATAVAEAADDGAGGGAGATGRAAAGAAAGALPWRRGWLPIAVPLVVVLVGAWHYRWVDEDAFIDFRVVSNLLAGHGPVFNVGERVEVDSDPLWLCTLALLRLVLPFVPLEWLSVGLGLVCTAAAFAAAGRAVAVLGASRGESGAAPLGLLVVSVVAGVWEFCTSGLEMSMVFCWLGLSFLLLVRRAGGGRATGRSAAVLGLGSLVRPELLPASVVLVAALVVVALPPAGTGRLRRAGAVVAAAFALPVAVELFRMAYYALAVPNTALAKAAGSLWWAQGLTYLWNFLAPYTLWLPLLLMVPIHAGRVRRWWRAGDRTGVVLLAAPLVAAATDALYVVAIGGDYMHARLLLPAFFCGCMPVFVTARQLRPVGTVAVAGVAVWSVVCAGWLRYPNPRGSLNPQVVTISNERDSWVSATGMAHPVTAADYRRALSGIAGVLLARTAARVAPGHQELVVVTDPYVPVPVADASPARSTLPFRLVVDVPAIGVVGYLAGPQVYLFDEFSLANPIGSHFVVTVHARPGHEKAIGPDWMVARFSPATAAVPRSVGAADVSAARAALSCGTLHAYLVAITAPFSLGRALSDVADAWRDTTMSFSADPVVAARQLCGERAAAARS